MLKDLKIKNSFIHLTFIEHLLWVKYAFGHWCYCNEHMLTKCVCVCVCVCVCTRVCTIMPVLRVFTF